MRRNTQYNYSKLLGRMKEKGFTQVDVAREIGISETTMSFSVMNKRAFKQDEMLAICKMLDIAISDIDAYFFSH